MAKRIDTLKKINDIVVSYLLENVGEMAVEGAPRYDDDKAQWVIPISCRTARGILPTGEIHLNKKLEIVYATPLDDMLQILEAQLKRLPFIVLGDERELAAKGLEALHV